MRIVALADTHMYHADLGRLPEGDLLIHAGDITQAGSLKELAEAAAWLKSHPHPHKILVAGNHDFCMADALAARRLLEPEVLYLEDSGTDIGTVSIWGSPWQPDFNDWAFNLPRGTALAEKWRQIPLNTDILVTHGPPRGIGDATGMQGRAGCEDLRAAAFRVRPALHLFGHIHQDGGLWFEDGICFANVNTWECERAATVIDLDPASRTLTPIAVPPRGV